MTARPDVPRSQMAGRRRLQRLGGYLVLAALAVGGGMLLGRSPLLARPPVRLRKTGERQRPMAAVTQVGGSGRAPPTGLGARAAPGRPAPRPAGRRVASGAHLVRLPPGVAPPPRYYPRDPNEWQGMLIDQSIQPECDVSAHCGLALACIHNRCGPCTSDSDCNSGEECVLDHCVIAANVVCRSRSDCPDGELCVLSGYSHDPRGNSDMRATCLAPTGGREEPAHTAAGEPRVAAQKPPVTFTGLRRSLGGNP